MNGHYSRRQLLAAAAGAGAVLAGLPQPTQAAMPGSWVLYVSASDCPTCQSIDQFYKADFVRGLQQRGIDFRQITVPSFHNIHAGWPADYQWVLDANPRLRGTPWFFFVNGRGIGMRGYGMRGFKGKFAPLAGLNI